MRITKLPILLALAMLCLIGTNVSALQSLNEDDQIIFSSCFIDGTIVAEGNMLTGNTNDEGVPINSMKVFNNQNEMVLHITECGSSVCSGSIASLPSGSYTATAYTSTGRSFSGSFTK